MLCLSRFHFFVYLFYLLSMLEQLHYYIWNYGNSG